MTDHLKTQWIFVGFCWMVVVCLTFWNLNKIDSIEKAREKKKIWFFFSSISKNFIEQIWHRKILQKKTLL